MIDFIEASFFVQEKLVRNLSLRLLNPLVQSVQDDLKDIRDQRKVYEKSRDRYDALVARFSSLPKLKEFSLVREDTYQLFEGRKTYLSQSFGYVGRISKFKMGADMFFAESCLMTMRELCELDGVLHGVLRAMCRPADEMQKKTQTWWSEAKKTVALMERDIKTSLDRFAEQHSPEAPFEPSKGVEKAGYLFKKRSHKGLGSQWKRVYLIVKDGFLYQEAPASGKRGHLERSAELHVLLCEVKVADGDRRNCFEVHTSSRTNLFQAESEEDMRDWIRVIENAKGHALRSSSTINIAAKSSSRSSSLDTALGTSSDLYIATDDDAASQLGGSVLSPIREQGVDDLVLSRITMANCPPPDQVFVSFTCLLLPLAKGTRDEEGSAEDEEGNDDADYREKKREESEGMEDRLRLRQLGQYQLGRLHGTADAFYFCGTLFGIRMQERFEWRAISLLTYSVGGLTGSVNIRVVLGASSPPTSSDQHHHRTETLSFKTFSDESVAYEMLHALWKNGRSDQPRPVAELSTALNNRPSVARTPSLESLGQAQGEVSCGCEEHLERTEIDMVLPVSVDELFHLLMDAESPVLQGVFRAQGYKNVVLGPWTPTAEGGRKERTLKMIVPLSHPMVKAKETECFEEHILLCEEPDQRYVIKQLARTPNVTYGDAFVMLTLFCITRHSAGHARLQVHTGLHWLKSPIVKAVIRNGTLKGMAEYMSVYRMVLRRELRSRTPEGHDPHGLEDEHEQMSAQELRREDTVVESAPSGWQGYLEIAKELLSDVRQRWRDNIRRADISVPSFITMLVSLLVLVVAISLHSVLSRQQRPFIPTDRPDPFTFVLPTNLHKDFDPAILEAHLKYVELRNLSEQLKTAFVHINRAQCQTFYAIYASWLAESLSTCLADSAHAESACDHLEAAWRETVRGHPCK